jgi:hypothetical protein
MATSDVTAGSNFNRRETSTSGRSRISALESIENAVIERCTNATPVSGMWESGIP